MKLILSRILPYAIIISVCILLSVIFESLILPESNQTIHSDVIVVLNGDTGRIEKGVELYKQGYSNKVLLSPVSNEKNGLNIKKANSLGLPFNNIITESKSTTTYSNVITLNEIMKTYNFKSAIIVTSDYHMKRTIWAFDRFKSNDYDVHYVSSLDLYGRRWYERPNKFNIWFSEFKKLTGYRLRLYKFIDE